MIKLTISQLFSAGPVLDALAQQSHRGEIALRIRRLCHKVTPEMTHALAARDTLITDENSVPAGPGTRTIKVECVQAFLAEPLFATEITIDAEPLTSADLAAATVAPAQLDALGPFFEDKP